MVFDESDTDMLVAMPLPDLFEEGLSPWERCVDIDETCWRLIRYPNLYASIAATIDFVVRSPRQVSEWIGKLMFWCGEDRIIYGSETLMWHPKWALDAFWDFEIPQDLVEGYGYPQLTERAKRKIPGENLLRLSGMDAQETPQRPNGAAWSRAGPWFGRDPILYWMTSPTFIVARWTSSIL